jgi:tetraacyldisaccharide 4'-kinase
MRYYLAPLAAVYGIIVWLRNRFYDWELLPISRYSVPVICVGNLAIGGAGKTPHVEYLIRLLAPRYRLAVLSRGYGRRTTGFVRADAQSSPRQIGDEPAQMKHKFPNVTIVVDANRRRAIRNLLALPEAERPEVILMDDGFQHRSVTPSLSILLTDSEQTYHRDRLLPVGRLREAAAELRRADAVIVTKCRAELTPIEARLMRSEMCLHPYQEMFLTGIHYDPVAPLFPDEAPETDIAPDETVLLLTGIARPQHLRKEIARRAAKVVSLVYPDHHNWRPADLQRIRTTFAHIDGPKRILVTEKDAVRIVTNPLLPAELYPYLYYVPISVTFYADGSRAFDNLILRHIEERRKSARYE